MLLVYAEVAEHRTVRPVKKPTKMNKFHIRVGIPSCYLVMAARRTIFGSCRSIWSH